MVYHHDFNQASGKRLARVYAHLLKAWNLRFPLCRDEWHRRWYGGQIRSGDKRMLPVQLRACRFTCTTHTKARCPRHGSHRVCGPAHCQAKSMVFLCELPAVGSPVSFSESRLLPYRSSRRIVFSFFPLHTHMTPHASLRSQQPLCFSCVRKARGLHHSTDKNYSQISQCTCAVWEACGRQLEEGGRMVPAQARSHRGWVTAVGIFAPVQHQSTIGPPSVPLDPVLDWAANPLYWPLDWAGLAPPATFSRNAALLFSTNHRFTQIRRTLDAGKVGQGRGRGAYVVQDGPTKHLRREAGSWRVHLY